jgi:hypothetical protein
MKSGTIPTEEIKVVVTAGLVELMQEVETHKGCGRLGEAAKWERFVEYTTEYLRLLENTVNASRETIRALESR